MFTILQELVQLNENNLRQMSKDKYSELLWKMDKWMPDEPDIQQEYYDIPDGDVEAMKDFLMNYADEDQMRRYRFDGNWDILAKRALEER